LIVSLINFVCCVQFFDSVDWVIESRKPELFVSNRFCFKTGGRREGAGRWLMVVAIKCVYVYDLFAITEWW